MNGKLQLKLQVFGLCFRHTSRLGLVCLLLRPNRIELRLQDKQESKKTKSTIMALLHSMEKSGNWLFRYRGQLPVLLVFIAIPFTLFAPFPPLSEAVKLGVAVLAGAISFLGLWIRAVTIGTTPRGTSGRNTQEQVAEVLNSTGIYSMVRHPLYLGNYLMWLGIMVYSFSISLVIISSLIYWIYYERIMFAEERFLERKFGDDYLKWSLLAPALIPRFSGYKPSSVPFSLKTVLRREYSGFLATVISFFVLDAARFAFWGEASAPLSKSWPFILGATALVVVVLKGLKKFTSVLEVQGRS